MKSHLSSELFCETAVDRSSVLSPGILGCVAGGGESFFLSLEQGGARGAEADQWRQVELGM